MTSPHQISPVPREPHVVSHLTIYQTAAVLRWTKAKVVREMSNPLHIFSASYITVAGKHMIPTEVVLKMRELLRKASGAV